MLIKNKFLTPELHPSFLLNNKQYSKNTLECYARHLLQSGEDFEVEIGNFLLNWLNYSESIQVKTSGSTGVPKIITIHKNQMINSAKATGFFLEISEASTALLCLSAKYIAGKMMLVRAMVLGWELDTVAPKSNPLDGLYKQYDFCAMVPLQLNNSVNRLYLLKKLIVGGGTIPNHLIASIQKLDTKVYETYGMTETITHIALRRVNSKKNKTKECYFKALPQVILSIDKRNCLVIKAPMLNNETIITNDIVDLLTFKKFLWKGRFDNVINSGGVKLCPEQIEKKMQLVIQERFFIASRADIVLGQKLILIIENANKSYTVDTYFSRINNLNTLDKYEIPKEIYFIEKFIETSTGKIHRSNNLSQLFNPSRKV